MRIAALDLGSNSFHLLVVEARLDGSFLPLEREREMLRLGDLVARTGRIGSEAIERALETVRRFKAVADGARCDEIVALGTAALREAADGGELVDRVRDATGIEIEVVDGVREARLIFKAVRSSILIDPGPALCADLGGGSLEVMVGDRGGLLFATSLRLGVARLTAELVEHDRLESEDWSRLSSRVSGELGPVLEEIADLKATMLVGSSGTFLCLARMAVAARSGTVPEATNQLSVAAEDFVALRSVVEPLTIEERQRLAGCDARRAELVPAGLVVLETLFALSGIDELVLSEWALREGIVLDAIGAHDRAELGDDPRALRRASVLSLCQRSNWRQRHARQVAALSTVLFDILADRLELGPDDRELLELGALLHDIGEHVSRADHDRHSEYLIENGGLRGFSPDEIRILSVLGRFHVRGAPKASASSSYKALSLEDRSRAVALVALLRVADALDAAHASVVKQVVRRDNGDDGDDSGVAPAPARSLPLRLAARVHGEAELEQWLFRRKKDLLEKVLGCELVLEIDRAGRNDLDLVHGDVAGLG